MRCARRDRFGTLGADAHNHTITLVDECKIDAVADQDDRLAQTSHHVSRDRWDEQFRVTVFVRCHTHDRLVVPPELLDDRAGYVVGRHFESTNVPAETRREEVSERCTQLTQGRAVSGNDDRLDRRRRRRPFG